jgi:23S rRNA (cytosine1962-C5)-methyltransferase
MAMKNKIILKPGREKSVRLRHPWIFAGALKSYDSSLPPGSTVEVYSHTGEWLARGSYNPHSQIAIRVWTWKETQKIDADYFRQLLAESIRRRENLRIRTNAMRLVNAENDGLPGLIIDQYSGHVVVQFLSAGPELWRQVIVDIASSWEAVTGVYERSDAEVREKEGLEKRTGVLTGAPPPEEVIIQEDDLWFAVDIRHGHKTGFYLDQRENRSLLGRTVHAMESHRMIRILNAFSYTGGFSVAARKNGTTTVTQVDSSHAALEWAKRNYSLNGIKPEQDEFIEQDVFELLRTYRDKNKKFDIVILDPPKFAFSRQGLQQATRAYKDINWLAMRLLSPGGKLLTFSCSGLVSGTLFQQVVFSAAMDAGRNASIMDRLGQASDHLVRLSFPEGTYLKGMLLEVE